MKYNRKQEFIITDITKNDAYGRNPQFDWLIGQQVAEKDYKRSTPSKTTKGYRRGNFQIISGITNFSGFFIDIKIN